MLITVLLADDHMMLRQGLRALMALEPGLTVVGEAGDGEEAVRLAEHLRPDVVVMDLAMPVLDGLEATRRIATRLPHTHVLVLTMHDDEDSLLRVIEAGGSGYLLKRSADTELMAAIHTVYRGEAFLYPSAVARLLRAYRQPDGPHRPADGQLTERECEVLRATAEGYSNREIGLQLYLSPKTVDTYRQRIMEKLELTRRPQLVHYALRVGLLQPNPSA